MKPIHFMLALLTITGAVMLFSCEDPTFFKGKIDKRTTYLYLDYFNPDTVGDERLGDAPSIKLNEGMSSNSIKIDFEHTFKGELLPESDEVKIIIDNLRISDEFGNFKIKNVFMEEYDDGRWRRQSQLESPVEYKPMQDLDVVMVLDASASVSPISSKVKNAAREFINSVSDVVANTSFGLIAIENELKITPIGEASQVKSDISNLAFQSRVTPLYDAVLEAKKMLQNTEAESKVMITLTDGLDKGSAITNLQRVVDSLKQQAPEEKKIQSYLIGLEGEEGVFEESIINDLAVRGFALFPKDGDEMQEFFDYFSKTVATVYSVTYIRYGGAIEEDNPKELRYHLETEQQ